MNAFIIMSEDGDIIGTVADNENTIENLASILSDFYGEQGELFTELSEVMKKLKGESINVDIEYAPHECYEISITPTTVLI